MSKKLNSLGNIPLSVPVINGNEWVYLKRCLDTGWVSSAGPFVSDFENAVCKYVKAKFAVACSNGTSGLFIALKLCGVREGDEVIVPTLTFIAPVNTVKYLSAEPVFMDCDNYLNLDVEKLLDFIKQECKLTKKGLINKKTKRTVKAIIPVHIFGNPCNLGAIMQVAKNYQIKVVEDATESLGAYYTEGSYARSFTGTIGDFGVYSFNGNKVITTGGGGMIITNSPTLARKAKYLINQAKDDTIQYIHHQIGYNFGLTNLQSALGLAQLENLDKFIGIKKHNYELYRKLLRGIDGIELLDVPQSCSPNYWFYSMLVDKERFGMDKEQLRQRLQKKNIQARPIWRLNHLQRTYRKNQAYRIKKATWYWKRVLNIPCSSNLNEAQINRVSLAIRGLKK